MAQKEQSFKFLIVLVSIVVPALVAVLFFMPKSGNAPEYILLLPKINAFINGSTSLVLIAALIAIKNGKRILHERLMYSALTLSLLFLLIYISYHALVESTHFGGEGYIKGIYYFILVSHILLAAAIVPLVLITYIRAFRERFEQHKKIARITFPIWLYVSITGVVVYLMISPYY